ncbi:formate dehydrogenase O subunit beta [Klebsiella pneumoniae subsp. pneumoniae]|uniref:Formate dehydrogenase O subunit beta n=1 Tax=Klebsiella pneumoniae subsp. pneumoniae TaxID=72407 RepID=A0A378AW81_KLEPN|nr:formate dehydrogenase O subunit beta [Klebsiella pneumoniae subsp. pneumoniae]
MAYQSQDIIRRSATNGFTPAPQARDHQQEVAKLIDVTTCIGCKACQVACSEWNDIRDEVGHNVGVYDNPADLTAKSWTVMRFSEVEQNDKLEWLIRKDGCMHCADPGCLKACPSEGAIIQYANGIVDFQSEQCIGCGYCIAGCPFDVPRLNPEDNRVYKCTLCVDRVTVGQEPACVKTCPTGAIHFGSKEDMKTLAGERVAELKTRGYDNAGLYDPAGVGGTPRHVRAAPCRQAESVPRPAGKPGDQPDRQVLERHLETAGGRRLRRDLRSQYLPLRRRRSEPRGRGRGQSA